MDLETSSVLDKIVEGYFNGEDVADLIESACEYLGYNIMTKEKKE